MEFEVFRICVPQGISLKINNSKRILFVKGKRGLFKIKRLKNTFFLYKRGYISLIRRVSLRKSVFGTIDSLFSQVFRTVLNGCRVWLILKGVGYRASVQDKKLVLRLGYRHLVVVEIPRNIFVSCPDRYSIVIRGCDFQSISQFAAKIRNIQPPEVYKGKGILFRSEKFYQKKGKRKR